MTATKGLRAGTRIQIRILPHSMTVLAEFRKACCSLLLYTSKFSERVTREATVTEDSPHTSDWASHFPTLPPCTSILEGTVEYHPILQMRKLKTGRVKQFFHYHTVDQHQRVIKLSVHMQRVMSWLNIWILEPSNPSLRKHQLHDLSQHT